MRRVLCVGLIGILVLAGCDIPVPAHQLGTAIPNARIEVVLPSHQQSTELFIQFESIAQESGFDAPKHPAVEQVDLASQTAPKSFQWNSVESSPKYPQFVRFVLPSRSTDHDRFTFILERMREDGFYEVEWREFMTWRDSILPNYFPAAKLNVTRHPAVFTKFERLEAISNATKEPIPLQVQERFNRWLETRN